MKKFLYVVGTIGGLLALSSLSCIFSTRIETNRHAVFDEKTMTMYFVVEGFHACPLTAEGSFPSWENSLTIHLHSEGVVVGGGTIRYQLGRDFTTQFQEASDGWLTFYPESKRASVEMIWKSSYAWQRVEGEFSLIPTRKAYQRP